jgi:hypothetical protein
MAKLALGRPGYTAKAGGVLDQRNILILNSSLGGRTGPTFDEVPFPCTEATHP